jgi:hypothetical protein
MTRLLPAQLCLAGIVATTFPALAQVPPAEGDLIPERVRIESPLVQTGLFTLAGTSLAIEVRTDAPGRLQVLRGGTGRVRVQARADGGLPGFAMSTRGRPRLHLTGVGAEELTFVVVVPDRTRVTVRLPDRALPESVRTMAASALFQWDAAETREPGDPGR